MNSLVVLFAAVSAVTASPSILAGLGGGYHRSSQYIAQPDAVSTQYREEVTGPEVLAAQPLAYAAQPLAYSAAWAPHLAPLAYSHYAPATILTPNGVPLDTPEVQAARAAHFQAKALATHGHYLKKRSIVEPLAYSAVYAAPSAVSHQSRVDINHSPVYAVAEPVIAKTVVAEPVYAAPSAVSHTSRVDVHSSPVLAKAVVSAPLIAEPVVYAAPSAVSHQARYDIHSKAALWGGHAPLISAYNALPLAPAHLSYSAPLSYW